MGNDIKFWFKNEKETLRKLGLNPVPGSGSGELYKEDGENEFVLCQLKSTKANQISVNKLDVEKLLLHSNIVGKVPVFAIQFINGPILLATLPEEFCNIQDYLKGKPFEKKKFKEVNVPNKQKNKKTIKSKVNSYEDLKGSLTDLNTKKEVKTGINSIFEKRNKKS